MKFIKVILFSLSLLSLGTISALSVQNLIDSGGCPEIVVDEWGVKTLDLSDKNLTSLEGLQNAPGIQQVKELHLNNNQLTTLPANIFNNLNKLENLSLNNNKLSTLPANIFNGLNGLEELSLDNNYLHPKEIQNLKFKQKPFSYIFDGQKNPFDLARQQFRNKNVFDALRGRELGARQFVRKIQKKDSPKIDESF